MWYKAVWKGWVAKYSTELYKTDGQTIIVRPWLWERRGMNQRNIVANHESVDGQFPF